MSITIKNTYKLIIDNLTKEEYEYLKMLLLKKCWKLVKKNYKKSN